MSEAVRDLYLKEVNEADPAIEAGRRVPAIVLPAKNLFRGLATSPEIEIVVLIRDLSRKTEAGLESEIVAHAKSHCHHIVSRNAKEVVQEVALASARTVDRTVDRDDLKLAEVTDLEVLLPVEEAPLK